MNIANILFWLKPAIEIIILWFVIYHIMLFFEGTRALQVIRGIIILLFAFLLFQKLRFGVLDWLMTKLFGLSVIAFLIIFHPEIRQGLARLGQRNVFTSTLGKEELDYVLQQLTRAVDFLLKNKIGALIAIERNDPLTAYVESGVLLDARLTSELIQTVFTPNSTLHDGGLIIQHGRIMAAGCLFPLTENQDLSRIFGMRHRAALGLSEETDSLVIVVSEERQHIILAYRGKFYRDLSMEDLIYKIKEIIKLKK